MVLKNVRVSVASVTDDEVTVQTDQGQTLSLPRHLLGEVRVDDVLYLAADAKPLVSSERSAKDTLNELIGGNS